MTVIVSHWLPTRFFSITYARIPSAYRIIVGARRITDMNEWRGKLSFFASESNAICS